MVVKEGYKNTEVGVIPEDWEVKTLGYIGDVKMCKRIFSYQTKESGIIPFYKIGTFGKEADAYISEELYNTYRNRFSFPKKGDILISASGTLGRTVVYDGKPAYFQDSNIIWIENDQKSISNKFLYHVLQVVQYESEGSTIQRLYNNIVLNTTFVLPPLKEQTAIATVLSDTDNLIQALEKKIAKKELIKKGAMQELLEPKEGWEVKMLGEIATIKTGSKNNQDKISDGKYPFFVRSQTIQRLNSYSYDCEAILIPGEGGIGSIYHYINGKFEVHQRVYMINNFISTVNGKFIYFYLKEYFYHHAMKNTVKATVDSLRLPTFLEFEITIPNYEEQNQIAQILDDIDYEIESLQEKLLKYKQLKQGLMQELLTGRIRLV